MTNQHPIQPSLELLERCLEMFRLGAPKDALCEMFKSGTDAELKAVMKWFKDQGYHPEIVRDFLAARRPKPPTLNIIALQMLDTIERDAHYIPEITDTIRKALEALPNDN